MIYNDIANYSEFKAMYEGLDLSLLNVGDKKVIAKKCNMTLHQYWRVLNGKTSNVVQMRAVFLTTQKLIQEKIQWLKRLESEPILNNNSKFQNNASSTKKEVYV